MKQSTKLLVKHMVCGRCIRVVREELEKLGFSIDEIELGKVFISGEVSDSERVDIRVALENSGFELLEDQQAQLVAAVKTLIIRHVHHQASKPASLNFSDFLAQELGVNYFQLSKLFSSTVGITIERYMISQKTERVKELLIYGELSLSEIADQLAYSSVAHLSGQFKKETGLTPTAFRKQTHIQRKPLDAV